MENGNDLLEQINQYKNKYYTDNNKNMLFKSSQKNDCAKQISGTFDLQEMFKITFFIIPNTNHIFMDYTKFKLFANESIYNEIIDYILYLLDTCIQKYGNYTIHFNIHSMTVSALERYKKLLEMYNNKCLSKNGGYSNLIVSFFIYHPPSAIDLIYKVVKHVLQEAVKNKIVLVPKNESDEKMKLLFV